MKKLKIYNHDCTQCRLHDSTHQEVCQPGKGSKKADVMVVSKMPNSKKYQQIIEHELAENGIDLDRVFFTAAVKCLSFDPDASKTDLKACTPYLQAEIEIIKPKWVLSFGNEALFATTGHSGIMKYRGHVIDRSGYSVIPTVSPGVIHRNPGQAESWRSDIRFFCNQVLGKAPRIKAPDFVLVNTQAKFNWLKQTLKKATLLSYDIETIGFDEFKPDSKMVSIAGTCVLPDDTVVVWALPLYHPRSPFRSSWQRLLKILAPYLCKPKKLLAHNGKFDARWLRQFDVPIDVTFDTMLAAHLLDENRQKGLKPLATNLLGVPAWAISTADLVDQPLLNVLEYNALDTYYTYQLYKIFRAELVEQPRQLRIFKYILTAANNQLIDAERYGVWVDRERLATNTKIAFDMRDDIEEQLAQYLPTKDEIYFRKVQWPCNAKGKPYEVNWNPSNFARWFLFDYLRLPVMRLGKDKADGMPGDPSMAEDVMLALRGMHPVVDLLLERSKWQKYCSSFLTTYEEQLDDRDRIHTTYKLAGTVTGRLSSGKVDADKITARTNIRGVNLQQVPRDPFIRGLFGAPPGYAFVEADFSQVELRVVAFISRDRTMLHLYQTGQDIHRATAAWVLGKPPDQVDKEDRKKAKAVNFGFVYGMGAPKFVTTAFEKYELIFSLDEAKAIRKTFFEQFRGLLSWHARQRRLVNQYGRVQSPLGRIRHLPDIFSEEQGVRMEAERQAINSPVQSFASDMTMLSMTLINQRFKEAGIDKHAHTIGTVHDALLFEVKEKAVGKALPIIKDTMENLPLQRLFGLHLDVPIVSDLKVGRHWGDARELEPDEVYDWNGRIDLN